MDKTLFEFLLKSQYSNGDASRPLLGQGEIWVDEENSGREEDERDEDDECECERVREEEELGEEERRNTEGRRKEDGNKLKTEIMSKRSDGRVKNRMTNGLEKEEKRSRERLEQDCSDVKSLQLTTLNVSKSLNTASMNVRGRLLLSSDSSGSEGYGEGVDEGEGVDRGVNEGEGGSEGGCGWNEYVGEDVIKEKEPQVGTEIMAVIENSNGAQAGAEVEIEEVKESDYLVPHIQNTDTTTEHENQSKYDQIRKNLFNSNAVSDYAPILRQDSVSTKKNVRKATLTDVFRFSHAFWILTVSSVFVYGKTNTDTVAHMRSNMLDILISHLLSSLSSRPPTSSVLSTATCPFLFYNSIFFPVQYSFVILSILFYTIAFTSDFTPTFTFTSTQVA